MQKRNTTSFGNCAEHAMQVLWRERDVSMECAISSLGQHEPRHHRREPARAHTRPPVRERQVLLSEIFVQVVG